MINAMPDNTKAPHTFVAPEQQTISPQRSNSCIPINAIRFVFTLVKNLSLMQLPKTKIAKQADRNKNGKGTIEPGLGTQAVFC